MLGDWGQFSDASTRSAFLLIQLQPQGPYKAHSHSSSGPGESREASTPLWDLTQELLCISQSNCNFWKIQEVILRT